MYLKQALIVCRTIHGMVYNAMKLFMEVNPQLFDDCSHDYAEQQNHAPEKLQSRNARWEKLGELAKARKNGQVAPSLPIKTGTAGSKAGTPLRADDSDPLSQESSRRLEGLRLQDDASGTSRRVKSDEVR